MKNIEEQNGRLVLTNLFGSIWLGDWERYEEIISAMDEDLQNYFPFHSEYKRNDVKLWYDNHFSIPGDHFISPYFSSYFKVAGISAEEGKQDLLCLIGMYEKLGFYFPLHQEIYPDHLGCLTAFLGAIMQEKIKASEEKDKDLLDLLSGLEEEVAQKYILPVTISMRENELNKLKHPFFQKFLVYYIEMMEEQYQKVHSVN